MKRIAVVVACVGAVAAGVGCDKGTLGTMSGGNQTGPGTTLAGIAGAASTGRAGAGPGGGSVIVGDPGGAGNGFPGVGGVGGSYAGSFAGSYAGSFAGSVGGPAGRVGTAGSTGRGGNSGRGGTGFVFCPAPPLPACGFPACGNGVIDKCQVSPNPGCPAITQVEECDGYDFGDSTCVGRGYASGALACSSSCTVDQSGCSDCVPVGGRVASCGPAPITFPYLATFAMASTDAEVGVGQVDYNPNTSESRLTFMRLDSRLGLISVAGVEDTSQPGPLQGVFLDTVAVAPTPSGWLVAACGGGNVFVHALDASGKKIARTVLSDGSALTTGCATGTLVLAPRPGGGALLMWTAYYDTVAVLIGADGSAGKLQSLMDPTASSVGAPSGAWTGDAYTIAMPVALDAAGYSIALRLLRVAADGTLTKVGDILQGEFSFAPAFVTGADGIRLTYSGVVPDSPSEDLAVMSRRIGPAGQLLADPITLGLYPVWFGRAPAVAFGDDTVVLMNGYQQELFTVVRLDAAAKFLSGSDVGMAPDYGVSPYDIVRLGDDVVVGWLRPGSTLTLARVTMP